MVITPFVSERLYQQMTLVDVLAGKIYIFLPVTIVPSPEDQGEDMISDSTRSALFQGETTIQIPGQPPAQLGFPIEASSPSEAVAKFSEYCEKALKELESRRIQQTLLTPNAQPLRRQ